MSCRGHGCGGRSVLASPPPSSALYVQRPCLRTHTVELDGLWQEWYERQVAGFELIKAQTKIGQAAQESWELLQRAKDVQNLSEWQKEAIEKAMLELEDVTPLGLLGAFRLYNTRSSSGKSSHDLEPAQSLVKLLKHLQHRIASQPCTLNVIKSERPKKRSKLAADISLANLSIATRVPWAQHRKSVRITSQSSRASSSFLRLADPLTLNLFNDTMRKYSGLLLGHPNKQEVRPDAFNTYEYGSRIHAPIVPLYEGQNEVAQSDSFVKNINDLCGFVSPRVEQSPDLTAQRH
ncbi:hypothetical protein D6D15_08535 [Aureobasidium pullulans]|uniref:Uncharacterized protein n=1 Tax=Aureobasidium pullulans TaxID=5580 RepID=A0A4S9AXH4_AURPU|nr:hypothetical protein D6D15_08535 [Aureobasidium pullulans]